jgi:hypothetical protein
MEVKGPHPNPSPKERELGGKSEECVLQKKNYGALLRKAMKLMWKNQCPDMIDSTAPSPLEFLAKERA